jgi:hypothetical protein
LLGNLSLEGNPIASKPDYREKVFEIFPELEVLDGTDRDGNVIESVEDDESDYGEEGEAEEMSEETRKRLQEQGFDLAEDDEEYDDEEDDEEDAEGDIYGDEDGEDEESEEAAPAAKRPKK